MDALSPPSALAQLQAIPKDPPKPTTHDVTIVTTRKQAQAKVLGVPPEEFGIERGARDIKTCNYCFHEVVTKTEAQIISEGYDEHQIKSLTIYSGNNEIETIARDSVQEHLFAGSDSINKAARLVKITEHYVRMDYEGNGRPCLYMVVTGGDQGEILRKDGKELIEPIDVIPFAATTPVPITHRFFGRSIADIVMEIQRIKTALLRGTLDNAYMVTNPRNEIAESHAGPNTLDDLLVSRPNGVIRTKVPGGLNVIQTPPIGQFIMPVMQYMDALLENKTGLTKNGQGIDANALQNQSATAVAQVFSASQMRMKLIARIMAEGVRDIFALLHHTIRSHGQEQQTVRLRNQWVPVDPRNWKTRDDMTIAVGLGTGGKAQQFAQIMALANFQKELLLGGKVNLVDDNGLWNTASEMSRIMGHKNADKFFNDPAAKDPQTGQPLHPPLPPPPNPETIKAQGQIQIEQTKLQGHMQTEAAKGQLEQQKMQAQAQKDAEKAQLDAFHAKLKLEGELQLAHEKSELEAKLALLDAALKEKADQRAHELHVQKMQHAEQAHQHKLQQDTQQHQNTMTQAAQTHGQNVETKQMDHRAAAAKVAPVDQIQKLHETLATHVKAVEEAQSAPVEIIRDKSGKASAIKRGNKTMTVQRGKDGRPEKLQ